MWIHTESPWFSPSTPSERPRYVSLQLILFLTQPLTASLSLTLPSVLALPRSLSSYLPPFLFPVCLSLSLTDPPPPPSKWHCHFMSSRETSSCWWREANQIKSERWGGDNQGLRQKKKMRMESLPTSLTDLNNIPQCTARFGMNVIRLISPYKDICMLPMNRFEQRLVQTRRTVLSFMLFPKQLY